MFDIINHIKTTYQFHAHGIYRFSPKVLFNFEVGPYRIKTAESKDELIECFRLRDEVFNKEFRGLTNTHFDFDHFDTICDHIIIVHKQTEKIIGTYRLNSSLYSNQFYTEQEFQVDQIRTLKGPILELGRACIRKEHRRGGVISLLWRGIAEYMNLSHSQVLFGCSSVKVTDARDAALIYQFLNHHQHLDLRYKATPQPSYEMAQFKVWSEYFEQNLTANLIAEGESMIPSLLRSYLKLGAKIIAEPALDEDFNCIDFLTLLEREKLTKSAEKKYGLETTPLQEAGAI